MLFFFWEGKVEIAKLLLYHPSVLDDNLFKVNKENCKFITDFKEMLHDCLQMEMVARKMADHEVTEHFIEEFKKKIVSVEEAWVTECGCESLGGDWGEAIHHIGKVIHNKVSCSAQAPRRRVDTCAECGQQVKHVGLRHGREC